MSHLHVRRGAGTQRGSARDGPRRAQPRRLRRAKRRTVSQQRNNRLSCERVGTHLLYFVVITCTPSHGLGGGAAAYWAQRDRNVRLGPSPESTSSTDRKAPAASAHRRAR